MRNQSRPVLVLAAAGGLELANEWERPHQQHLTAPAFMGTELRYPDRQDPMRATCHVQRTLAGPLITKEAPPYQRAKGAPSSGSLGLRGVDNSAS